MKKLLAIVVLGLLWNGNFVFGYDIPEIKVKNLKCLHKEYKKEGKTKKEDHLYIIFSDDKISTISSSLVIADSKSILEILLLIFFGDDLVILTLHKIKKWNFSTFFIR